MDEHGHTHGTCNRCRDLIEMERIARNLSDFSFADEVNDENDGNGRTSVWGLDVLLWGLDTSSQLFEVGTVE